MPTKPKKSLTIFIDDNKFPRYKTVYIFGPIVIKMNLIWRCDSAAKGKWTEHRQEEEIDEKTLRVRK